MATEKQIEFEATVGDVRYHNSKIDENRWVDLTVRILGEVGIIASMNLFRAKGKVVKISYEPDA